MDESVVQSPLPPNSSSGEGGISIRRRCQSTGHVAEAVLALVLLVAIGGVLAVALQGSGRIVGLIGVGALLTVLALWKLPQWQAEAALRRNPDCDVFAAENAARTTLAQALGGFLLIGGLAASCSQLYEARQEQRQAQAQAADSWELEQQGQLTDRFTTAVTQLSSAEPVVVLGGIYALERIAHDSPPDAIAAMETLAAYVRQHAPPSKTDGPIAEEVQAALSAIGRGDWTEWLPEPSSASPTIPWCLDLTGVHLPGVVLIGGTFPPVCLQGAVLKDAVLAGVDLTGADLTHADLSGAWVVDADLSSTMLEDAVLTGAWLVGGTLESASLRRANLSEATLISMTFAGADLESVILKNAWLVAGGCSRLVSEAADADPHELAIIRQWRVLGSHRIGPDFNGALHLTQEQINAAVVVDETVGLPEDYQVPTGRGCEIAPHPGFPEGNVEPAVAPQSTPLVKGS